MNVINACKFVIFPCRLTSELFCFQNQFSYKVIEGLLNHLDFHTESNPTMRANIIEVIATAVSATSGGSIGKCFGFLEHVHWLTS